MPVGIVEVANNTPCVLHYRNEESGYEVTVQASEARGDSSVYIPCSKYKDDTVPFRSSGKKIVVSLMGQGQFAVCDDNWKLRVMEDGRPDALTDNIRNGDRFVMVVNWDGVKFERYIPAMTATDWGFITTGSLGGAAEVVGNIGLALIT